MEAGGADVFEVFRVGSLTAAQLEVLGLEEARKTYTRLAPITDLSEITGKGEEKRGGSVALARVPQEGHIVVDKESFQTMIREKVEAAVKNTKVEEKIASDEKICSAYDRLAADRKIVTELLQSTVLLQQQKLEAILAKAREGGEGAATAADSSLQEELCSFARTQKETYRVLFTHPLFADEEAEE